MKKTGKHPGGGFHEKAVIRTAADRERSQEKNRFRQIKGYRHRKKSMQLMDCK